jgi:hypothetical protein
MAIHLVPMDLCKKAVKYACKHMTDAQRDKAQLSMHMDAAGIFTIYLCKDCSRRLSNGEELVRPKCILTRDDGQF